MSKRIDLTGQKFERLKVIRYAGTKKEHWHKLFTVFKHRLFSIHISSSFHQNFCSLIYNKSSRFR